MSKPERRLPARNQCRGSEFRKWVWTLPELARVALVDDGMFGMRETGLKFEGQGRIFKGCAKEERGGGYIASSLRT